MRSQGQYETIVRYDSNAQKVLCIFHGNGTLLKRELELSAVHLSALVQRLLFPPVAQLVETTSLTFDSNVNKFLMLFQNYGNELIKGTVLTVSGTSVSSGTQFTITGGFNSGAIRGTFLPSLNKIIFMNNYSTTTYYSIVTINGTGITENYVDVTYTGYGEGSAFVTVAGDKQFLSFKEGADAMASVEVEITATEMKFAPTSQIVRWGTGTSGDSVYDPDTG